MSYAVPPGTPWMAGVEVVSHCTNPDAPELCPACGHATLFTFAAVAVHDDGVTPLGTSTACGSDECADEE